MKAIIVEDSLASNGPHVKALTERDFRFMRGAKPKDRELPSGRFEAGGTRETWERRDRRTGALQRFDWECGLPLNDARFGLKADMPECVETRGKDDNLHLGHRSSARPAHGAGGHAPRPSAVGD